MADTSKKPTLFIGSSYEATSLATTLKGRIDYHTNQQSVPLRVRVWHQNLFLPTHSFIDDLLEAGVDYAVLLFSPNDTISSRGKKQLAPRDNIIFECGLFFGRLGKQNVYIIRPSSLDLKIPSDLAGLNFFVYDGDDEDEHSAIDYVALQIVQAIKKQGNKGLPPVVNRITNKIDTLGSSSVFKALELLVHNHKVTQSDLEQIEQKGLINPRELNLLLDEHLKL